MTSIRARTPADPAVSWHLRIRDSSSALFLDGHFGSAVLEAFKAIEARAFAATIGQLGARHKVTRPFRPQTNGKAERFIQTMLAEWAYARLYHSNNERLAALDPWVEHYNCPVARPQLVEAAPADARLAESWVTGASFRSARSMSVFRSRAKLSAGAMGHPPLSTATSTASGCEWPFR